MNHLFHTLSPILLLTSVILLILTYLSPVLIFSDSVSLLSVTLPAASNTSSSLARREWRSVAELNGSPATQRMVRKIKRSADHFASHSLNARATNETTSGATVQLFLGPMGACHKSSTNSTASCQSPSFTPIFDELLATLSSSSSLAATLPSQFPLAPTALFLSFLFLAGGLVVSLSHAGAHHVARLGRLQAHASRMRRWMVGAVGAGWVLGVAVTLCLFVELRRDVEAFGEVGVTGASAALGNGFQLLVACWSLSLISLLLGAETFANRAR